VTESAPDGPTLRGPREAWVPGAETVEADDLDYDPTAYDSLTTCSLGWPCLSFDFLRDGLGAPRSQYPHELFFVSGSQAAPGKANYLSLIRATNVTQGRHGAKGRKKPKAKSASDSESSDSESSDSDDSEAEEEQSSERLHTRRLAHPGGEVNRVRSMPQTPGVVAAWASSGLVSVWDLGKELKDLQAEPVPDPDKAERLVRRSALHAHGHSAEGFALDWSLAAAGSLASGDGRGSIHVWTPAGAGKWSVGAAYKGHGGSVEDLQWSPVESTVFASGSCDRSIRIWDTRAPGKAMLAVENTHEGDVNVLSWSAQTPHMLASGGDDALLRVWDLRIFAQRGAVASLKHHRGPVTSVEWCPHEASMLLTTGADHQTAVWDLSLERDPEEELALQAVGNALMPEDVPPQLLFVHAGQHDVKEGHWHPHIPGLMATTAADGFNLFKPANVC
ncbi:hypothetical protein H632_c2320p0, partial [Helicosporidium sp. ATCC 50920]